MPKDKLKIDSRWVAFVKWAKGQGYEIPNDERSGFLWDCWVASWDACGKQITEAIHNTPYR